MTVHVAASLYLVSVRTAPLLVDAVAVQFASVRVLPEGTWLGEWKDMMPPQSVTVGTTTGTCTTSYRKTHSPPNSALQHMLNEPPLLWVHHLVIAVLQFAKH